VTPQALRSLASEVPGPDDITALHELQEAIDRVLGTLIPREALIVRRYFGLEGEGDGCTSDELGRQLGISSSRVNQIVAKALRKMRHPSRCMVLSPHVVPEISRRIGETARRAEEAERIKRAKWLIEETRRAEDRRAKEVLRRRIGDEVGSLAAPAWWSDNRRQDIAAALDLVVSEAVTEVRSSFEVSTYLGNCFTSSWKIYDAWKRDVRRRHPDPDGVVAFTHGILTDGSCLIYARRGRCTWYLFKVPYARWGDPEFYWVGYVDVGAEVGDAPVRRSRIQALDQGMLLVVAGPWESAP